MKKVCLLLCLLAFNYFLFAQRYVDAAGTCGGNSPCYITIQAAVTAATGGQTINVYPGTYTELVAIEKPLTLRSTGGKAVTTIKYNATGSYIAPIMIQADAGSYSGVTIGGTAGNGFTIIGTDVSNNVAGGAVEAAAIIIGSNSANTISNINISFNTITCNGDGGLITYYKSVNTYSNVSVSDNFINGKTYISPATAGGYFSHGNVPRFAIGVNPGTSNFIFNHNTVSSVTGEIVGAANIGRGTIYAEPTGSVVTNNIFMPTIAASSSSILRLGGTASTISCNYFSLANGNAALYYITPPAAAPYTVATAAANNTFANPGANYSGSSIYKNTMPGTAANSDYPAPGCTVLPLIKMEFYLQKINNAVCNMVWETTGELNCAGFEVQGSNDGIHFSTITFIPSIGDGDHHYQYIYTYNAATNLRYFRIKQNDKYSTSFRLSVIKSVEWDKPSAIYVSPNPVTSGCFIFNLPQNEICTIKLFDVSGRQIAQQKMTAANNQLNIEKAKGNFYFYQVINNAGQQIATGKLSVLH